MEPRDGPFDLARYSLSDLAMRSGGKWARARPGGIAAWVADMDFPVAPAIRDALERAVSTDDLGYPSETTLGAARAAFARRLADRYGLGCGPEDVVLAGDVVQCIYAGIEAFTEPGDGVVFLTPTYPPFFTAVSETGRRAVTCDLVAGPGGYRIDLGQLGDLVARERPRCLLLCNPHNPTGRAFDEAELSALSGLACEHDMIVLADEIHADLVLRGAEHIAIGALGSEIAARVVTLTSASKAFNIAGLHCAAAVFASKELRGRFERIPAGLRGGIGSLGLLGVLAAYGAGEPWLEAVLDELDANRRAVSRWAAEIPGVVHHPPEATYLAWIDVSACGLGEEPARALESATGVVLSPGTSFGRAGAGHVRLNFATPRPVLDEMLERLKGALST